MFSRLFSNRSGVATAVALSGLSLATVAATVSARGARATAAPAARVADVSAHRTSPFRGAKANTGYATHTTRDGKSILMLSDDFKIPDTPAPHWQVVDSHGNAYLLQRLKIKGDKYNQTIEVPSYVHDVAKVQIWCAWAEVLLGEASFATPVK
jgi:hypothetical protein